MKSRPAIGAGLMLMSFGSGCVDVLSYRFLGEVFPSAMTGNLALMGLSLGQGDAVGAIRNLCALGSFCAGLLLGARLLGGSPTRARFILTLGLQAALLLAFALLWDRHGLWRFGLIGLAAAGMGLQSAVAFRIGVTGVSTTYFTGTLTNIAFRLVGLAPAEDAGAPSSYRVGWAMLALLAYFSGALAGGWSLAGRFLPDLPVGLAVLPLITTLILGVIIAIVRPAAPDGS